MFTGKLDWICKSCYSTTLKNKMPMQAQVNSMELCPKFTALKMPCPIELMLVSPIVPLMFYVAQMKSAQYGLIGQFF